MYLTIKGLVLRVTHYNDTDAFLTVLSGTNGILTLKARGLRRKNSSLIAPCQLLTYSEFTLFEYKDAYTINEASCISQFRNLRKDLQKLSLGTYFAQVAEALSQEDQPDSAILSLVLNCLHALSDMDLPEMQIKAVFELRGACIAGYSPDLSMCRFCGNLSPNRFNLKEARLECNTCQQGTSTGIRMPLNDSVLEAMRYICTCNSKRLFSFALGNENLELLSQITEGFLATQLERGFPTLDFYKSLFIQ